MPSTDPIPISALQHYLFCPRQCALIHVDGLWAENRLTAHGRLLHERVDTPGGRLRRPRDPDEEAVVRTPAGKRIVRALPLLSERLGLTGKADTVEFPIAPDGSAAGPPRPVEHKRGRPKRIDADRAQLCAQALCLEEMLGVAVPEGELFYHAARRRERVAFDDALRRRTIDTIAAVRGLIERNAVPRADRAPKCRNCSLRNLCLPEGTGPARSPSLYLSRALAAVLAADVAQPDGPRPAAPDLP